MLTVENLPASVKFNYAIHHAGLDSWDRIAIRSCGTTATGPSLLEVAWSALARPHVLPVPALRPGQSYPSGRRTVPLLDLAALGKLTERQRLTWDVRHGADLIHRSDVVALAANEWTWVSGAEAALAAFVEPNSAAARDILGAAAPGLAGGYQDVFERGNDELTKGAPANSWTRSARQIYECIRSHYRWRYEYEPPSFETDGQKIRDPDTVWKDLEGTCLDLALAFASCLERAYLRPLVIVLRRGEAQHALAGWWIQPPSHRLPVWRSKADLCALVPHALEVVECTGFAEGRNKGKPLARTDFQTAVAAARRTIQQFDLCCTVDIQAAREQLDITPLAAFCGAGDAWRAGVADWIRTGTLRVGDAVRIGVDVCKGFLHISERLGAAAAGFAHRDIKPSNILLNERGVAKVTDFGLAISVQQSDLWRANRHGIAGTPPYMAPEQWLPDGNVDRRSDIYSFGCVLYEMLVGRQVFEVSGESEWQEAHQRRAPPSLDAYPKVPGRLRTLVAACLEKDPRKRPQNFREVKAELERS